MIIAPLLGIPDFAKAGLGAHIRDDQPDKVGYNALKKKFRDGDLKMAINADKPSLWKKDDIKKSVDQYNNWFIHFAPTTYRETRRQTIEKARHDLENCHYPQNLTSDILVTLIASCEN